MAEMGLGQNTVSQWCLNVVTVLKKCAWCLMLKGISAIRWKSQVDESVWCQFGSFTVTAEFFTVVAIFKEFCSLTMHMILNTMSICVTGLVKPTF